MAAFHAVYYRDTNGTEPVREFLDELDDEVAAVLGQQIDRLNMLSDEIPHLPFPHTSQVDGELRELRCHYGRQLFRVLYRARTPARAAPHLLEANGQDPRVRYRSRPRAMGRLQGTDGRRSADPTPTGRARCALTGRFAELLTFTAR